MLPIILSKNAASAINALQADKKAECIKILKAIPAGFGKPHVHQGLGIRQLRPGQYEARCGLDLRAVFVREGNFLVIMTVGNHDHVRTWLKAHKKKQP
jgi:hypothetical protein